MSITAEQFAVLATIPMITGSLSVLGSSTIIFMVFGSREKLSTTYHRILFGMSSMDIIYSTASLLSTIPFPRDTPSLWGLMYGNTATCTIQGLFLFSGNIGSNAYNCSLAMFYMLTIVYGVRDELMKKRIEPFFHAVPLVYIVGADIFLLIKKSFNPLGTMCLITPYPRGCQFDPNVNCARGEHAAEDFWSFHAWPVITMFFIVLLVMAKLYHAVRSQEKKMQSYQISSTLPVSIQRLRNTTPVETSTPEGTSQMSWLRSLLRKTFRFSQPAQNVHVSPRESQFARKRRDSMIQCFLYVLAFFICYIFVTIHQLLLKRGKLSYTIWVLAQIFTPLQGLLNFFVFVRPRMMGFKRAELDLTLFQAFMKAVTSTMITPVLHQETRRRKSLRDTQQNGGKRFTAREFHLRELKELEALDAHDETHHEENKGDNKGLSPLFDGKDFGP